jgi:hypothetical protein
MTIMGTGNESDFTLSPRALDELLKVIAAHDLPLAIDIFIGDGHHDALPFYRYCRAKGVRTIIPLNGDTASDDATEHTPPPHPHLDAYPDVVFDTAGTPLCPGGARMRHQQYRRARVPIALRVRRRAAIARASGCFIPRTARTRTTAVRTKRWDSAPAL